MDFRKLPALIIAATALLAMPALIDTADAAKDRKIHKVRNVRGTPGPIAGVGLPFLVLAGGYAAYRRKRARNSTTSPKVSGTDSAS